MQINPFAYFFVDIAICKKGNFILNSKKTVNVLKKLRFSYYSKKRKVLDMNTDAFWNYKAERTKKTVSVKDEQVMLLNISHPVFETDPDSKTDNSFILKINKFYSHIADKYSKTVLSKYTGKAARIYSANGGIMTAFLMNCTVAYNTEEMISVFSDLSYYDGKKKKTVRFSQNWSPKKSAILPPSYIFEKNTKSKRHITEIIAEIAADNMKNKNFSYYSDFETIIRRKFDFDNFYFVPKGVAFFYNAGILSDDGEPCIFVIPCHALDGILKPSLT